MYKTSFFLLFLVYISSCKHSFDKEKRLRFKDSSKLKAEFDLCPWWDRAMDWDDYLEARRKLERPELFKYVDKIMANENYKKQGYDVIPVYYASHQKINFIDKIKVHKKFVAKPSHMSASTGLIIFSHGLDLVSKQPIRLEDVQERMFHLLDSPSNSDEWYLQNTKRGFLIQEYIEKREEIKFHTVWGRVVTVTLLNSDELKWYKRDETPIANFLSTLPPAFPYPDLFKRGIELAEKIAARSDALRVDFLIKFNKDGSKKLLLNELELRSQTGGPEKASFIQLVHHGYQGMCVPY